MREDRILQGTKFYRTPACTRLFLFQYNTTDNKAVKQATDDECSCSSKGSVMFVNTAGVLGLFFYSSNSGKVNKHLR